MAFLPQFVTFESIFKTLFDSGGTKDKENEEEKKEEKEEKKLKKKVSKKPKEKNSEVNESVDESPTTTKKKKKKKEGKETKKTHAKKRLSKDYTKEITEKINNIIIAESNTESNNENKKNNAPETKNNKNTNKKIVLTEETAINKIVNNIRSFIFIKKVKELIKLHKDNFAIICTTNNSDLSLSVNLEGGKTLKYKLNYDPLLQQNIAYIPRKRFAKKNLLKFNFINKDNETIIDPKYNTEYDGGNFINVINLKKIKDKEGEREDEFQSFLEDYFTVSPPPKAKLVRAATKLTLESVKSGKKNKTLDTGDRITFLNKTKSCLGLDSILKQRGAKHKRIPSDRKISFGNVKFSYYKNK